MSTTITSYTRVYFKWDDSGSDGSGSWKYSTDGSSFTSIDSDSLIDSFTTNPGTVSATVQTNATYLLEVNFVQLGVVPSQMAVVISSGYTFTFSLAASLASSGSSVTYRLIGAYNAGGNGGTVRGTDPTFKLTRSN
jgi:hypothetical protein